jgi:hypothetical protein
MIGLSIAVALSSCGSSHSQFREKVMIQPHALGAGWQVQPQRCEDTCEEGPFLGCPTEALEERLYSAGINEPGLITGFTLQGALLEGGAASCIDAEADLYRATHPVDRLRLPPCSAWVVRYEPDPATRQRLVKLFVAAERSAAGATFLFDGTNTIDEALVERVGSLACEALRKAEATI